MKFDASYGREVASTHSSAEPTWGSSPRTRHHWPVSGSTSYTTPLLHYNKHRGSILMLELPNKKRRYRSMRK
jgi:hypothetical protein